jgi:hypothetical protein
LFLSPTGSITLVPQLREDFLLCSSHLNLGVTNLQAINKFSGAVAGKKEDFCKGESHFQSFTLLLFCFTLFLLASFYQKYKKKVPTVVVIFVGLLLSCFIMLSINGWFL